MAASDRFLVATAIPYVNDRPHLGHAILFLYADVLARWQRYQGRSVLLTTGTDEHGTKIAEKAASLGLTPLELVDQMSARARQALDRLEISYDRFVRTTSPQHKAAVACVWDRLGSLIYKGQYRGAYCVGCEEYKSPTVVEKTAGRCPNHDREYEDLSETNYFLRVSAVADRVRDQIEADQIEILPQQLKTLVLNDLAPDQVRDIPIARPRTRVGWGIAVPNDPDYVIYVWFEALLNYISILGYPDGDDFKRFWPATVQIIGRDIIRFHAIIWPAILIGLDIPVYKKLYAHGLITVSGKKMSKTLGNSVDPLDLIDLVGVDGFRNYFIGQIPSYQDGDYDRRRLIGIYNSQIVDSLGNLLYRLQALIERFSVNLERKSDAVDWPDRPDLETVVGACLDQCRFDRALGAIWAEINFFNQQLEVLSPWKTTDSDLRADQIRIVAAKIYQIAPIMGVFLPETGSLIEKTLSPRQRQPLTKPPFTKISPEESI